MRSYDKREMPSFGYEMLMFPIKRSSPKLSLRQKLLRYGYQDAVEPIFFEPSAEGKDSSEEFVRLTAKWLKVINRSYGSDSGYKKGVCYASSYSSRHEAGASNSQINFMANSEYWNVAIRGKFEENTEKQHTPSEMLNAFFVGPTIAECATVLQACQYRAIEEIVGTRAFNKVFGKSLTKFLITPLLFNPVDPDYSANREVVCMNKGIMEGAQVETQKAAAVSEDAISDAPSFPLNKSSRIDNPLITPLSETKTSTREEHVPPNKMAKPDNWFSGLFPETKTVTRNEYTPPTLTDSDIQIGDVVHIAGVDKYNKKHLEGSGIGWNVLCVGKDNGKSLYLGFSSSGHFHEPETYAEVAKILIDEYNQDHSPDTKTIISRAAANKDQDYQTAKEAEKLKHDKVGHDYPIVGIQYRIPLNKEVLKLLMLRAQRSDVSLSWHNDPLVEVSLPDAKKDVRNISPFSIETKDKTFDDYQIDTDTQSRMATAAKKFVYKVLETKDIERDAPIGLVMTGAPGLGKTHLSVAAANLAAGAGAEVLFLDSGSVKKAYSQECAARKCSSISQQDCNKIFEGWIDKADLVVFDDMNCSDVGTSAWFLQSALSYVLKNNKAMMLSSNEPINLKKHLPHYISYNSPLASSFVVMSDLQGASHRKEWHKELTGDVDIAKITPAEKTELLAKYKGKEPAGIIIESSDINLEAVKEDFLTNNINDEVKVRVIGEPYIRVKATATKKASCTISPDFYMHDDHDHDVFIIKVTDFSECEQLLNLLPIIHDQGKRVVVVTDNQEKLSNLVKKTLGRWHYEKNSKRLTGRIQNLFLEDLLVAKAPEAIKVTGSERLVGEILDRDECSIA